MRYQNNLQQHLKQQHKMYALKNGMHETEQIAKIPWTLASQH